eukprot:6209454-Pleurochrysis_carterae.AAC.6
MFVRGRSLSLSDCYAAAATSPNHDLRSSSSSTQTTALSSVSNGHSSSSHLPLPGAKLSFNSPYTLFGCHSDSYSELARFSLAGNFAYESLSRSMTASGNGLKAFHNDTLPLPQ